MSDINGRLNDSIAEAVKEDGDFVLKWVCLIEVLDKEGERNILRVLSDEAASWDILGYLQYAIQMEQTENLLQHMVMLRGGEDED